MLPPDNHVHTKWSWDAVAGSIEQSCARAEARQPDVAVTAPFKRAGVSASTTPATRTPKSVTISGAPLRLDYPLHSSLRRRVCHRHTTRSRLG
jgi:hypothetical protein